MVTLIALSVNRDSRLVASIGSRIKQVSRILKFNESFLDFCNPRIRNQSQVLATNLHPHICKVPEIILIKGNRLTNKTCRVAA
jgi:hypothetical protein